jgi:hypothetical protein
MLNQPKAALTDLWFRRIIAKPLSGRSAQRTACERANQRSFKPFTPHPVVLFRNFNKPERKLLSQDSRYLCLNRHLFADVAQMPMPFAYRSFHEVQFPDGKVTVPRPIEERTANILAKDTPIMRSGLISAKCHLPFVQQEMFSDARLEITVPVRANSDNPRLCFPMITVFPSLVKEVNSVSGQRR